MISRLTLGTAQLGMDYGIANKAGKPSKEKAFKILRKAFELGINSIDTASAYGDSEQLIGNFLAINPVCRDRVFITTKLPSMSKLGIENQEVTNFVEKAARASFKKLGVRISNFMLHDFHDLQYGNVLEKSLIKLKQSGIIDHVGVSIYEPEEAESIMQYKIFDTIQLPINLLDHRFLKNNLLKRLKARGFTVFARSVFLQGLLTMNPANIPKNLSEVKNYFYDLREIAINSGLKMKELAIAFVASITEVDSIVIGVDNENQLVSNFEYVKLSISQQTVELITQVIRGIDESIIDPRKW